MCVWVFALVLCGGVLVSVGMGNHFRFKYLGKPVSLTVVSLTYVGQLNA